jgi:hypothetical protein
MAGTFVIAAICQAAGDAPLLSAFLVRMGNSM